MRQIQMRNPNANIIHINYNLPDYDHLLNYRDLYDYNGGRNSGSVSAKTSFLLAGTKPGPEKIRKCEELGIPVIGEEAFFAMLPADAAAPAPAAAAPSLFDDEPTLF